MIGKYYAVDFQVHSLRSHDGKAPIDEICERAVRNGVDEIGFTEHKDFDPADPVVEYFDYEKYMDEIEGARKKFGSLLTIRAGVEIDYQLWFEDKIDAYLASHPFDYVLGSVHYVDRVKIMTAEYNRTRTAKSAYGDYFAAVLDSVKSGFFDVVGHLEYANRIGINAWGPYDSHDYRDCLIPLFDLLIAKGLTLEINTAGLFHGTGNTYPCFDSVALYAERGGKNVVFGSDAHVPEQVGYRYEPAAAGAASLGLSVLSVFDKRKRIELPMIPSE